MHGIVDLEPPVYSSIDVDDSAPLHRRGLIRRPLTQNPSSSSLTWAHGLVRRPLTRAPSPSLSLWACRLSPPSSSTWARPPSVDAGSLVCRPLTRAPSPSSPSWACLSPLSTDMGLSSLFPSTWACLRPFHRHGLVFALSVVMGLSFAPLHRHGLVFALSIDMGLSSPSPSTWAPSPRAPALWGHRLPQCIIQILHLPNPSVMSSALSHRAADLRSSALSHRAADLPEGRRPVRCPETVVPLTCSKAVVPLTCPNEAVDLSDVRRPSCR